VLFCYYLCCSVYCNCVLYQCHRVFTQLLLTNMSIIYFACFFLGPSNAERKAPISFVVSICPSVYITWRHLWKFFSKKVWYWRLLIYPYSSSKFGYNRTRMSVSLLQNLSIFTLLTAALNVLNRNSNDKEIHSCLPWQNSNDFKSSFFSDVTQPLLVAGLPTFRYNFPLSTSSRLRCDQYISHKRQ